MFLNKNKGDTMFSVTPCFRICINPVFLALLSVSLF